MEIEIIRIIQTIRNDFFDNLMLLLTQLGDIYVFILIAATFYWIINKKFAFKLTVVFLLSALTVELTKGIFRRQRPFFEDPSLNVGPRTSGFSLPSGHSQNATVIATSLFMKYNKKIPWLKYLTFGLVLLVGFTRVYLGQHYPSDVLLGIIIGIIVTIALSKFIDLTEENHYITGLLISIPMFVFLIIFGFIVRDYELVKNIFTATGGFIGFGVGYFLEVILVNYNTESITKSNKIIRMLIGAAGVIVLYLGLSWIFKAISPENLFLDALRYGIVALWVTLGSMFTFKKLKI